MLKYLLSASFACSLLLVYAQDYPNLLSPSKVSTVGYWKLGEIARYHVVQQKQDFKGTSSKPAKEEKTEYDIQVKVVDSTATMYELELSYSNYHTESEAAKFFRDFDELQSDLTIRYRTDELGAFDTILNLPELRDELLQKLEVAKTHFKTEKNAEEAAALFNLFIDNFSRNFQEIENVEGLFLTDIVELHGYYGIEMALGKPMELELEFPTIGDIVLKGTGKLTLNSIRTTADECTFTATGKPDKEQLKTYIEKIALLFMMGNDRKKPDMEDITISMSSKSKMKMELSSGWMTSVSDTNTFTLKTGKDKQERKSVGTRTYVKK